MADFENKHLKSAKQRLAGTMRMDQVQRAAGNKFNVQGAQMEQAQQISDDLTVNHQRNFSGDDYDQAIKTTYRKD